MTSKEALDRLTNAIKSKAVNFDETFDFYFWLAVSDALKRQTPQKPITEMPEYEDGYELYPGGVYCPNCERWLRTDEKLTFCQDCGQAIDWEGFGETDD